MFTIDEILKATNGKLVSGQPQNIVSGISTDSRTINRGELFIALKGDNFDGYNFINECLVRGATGILISNKDSSRVSAIAASGLVNIIKVPDTLKALGDIAYFHRMRFNIPVIGITGSNGKTTTKDMIAHLLGVKYKVLKNLGTLNNFIGVPLTILKLNKEHQICVLEMGTNHVGEISRLTDIARPNIGIITNVGPSHLEFFKDLETVSRAKMELFKNFNSDHIAIWNADDGMLSSLYQNLTCKKRTFGLSNTCDFKATNIESIEDGWRFALNESKLIKIKLLGKHNVYNALAAITLADAFGINYSEIHSSLLSFKAPSMRMEILEVAGIKIINDCYNSNPKSVESAINVLSNFNASGRRIFVSGDMLELGEISNYFHHQIGLNVAASGIDIFIGVGPLSKESTMAAVRSGMNKDAVMFCEDSQKAGELLRKTLRSGDVVLIKGSRGMKMEKACSTIYSIH